MKENIKVAGGHIVELLKPTKWKSNVENDLALFPSDLRKEWKVFYKYLVQIWWYAGLSYLHTWDRGKIT